MPDVNIDNIVTCAIVALVVWRLWYILTNSASRQDRQRMRKAALQWGGLFNPHRRWFYAGWQDELHGEAGKRPPIRYSPWLDENQQAQLCAYNSGVIAQREGV
jgi:hypothetical protein